MPRKPKPTRAEPLVRWDAGLAPCQAPLLPEDEAVDLGRLGKPWGLKGDQRLQLFNPEISTLKSQSYVYLGDDAPERACLIASVSMRSGKPLIRLSGVESPEGARLLVGKRLWIGRGALPELDEDEVYLQDLLGLGVKTMDGTVLGRVEDFLDNGAQDVLVIRGERGETLIPLVEEIVRDIDLDSEQILVDFIPGD